MRNVNPRTLLLLAVATIVLVTTLSCQSDQPPAPTVGHTGDVTDDDLRNFIRTVDEIGELQTDLRQRMLDTSDAEGQQRLQQEMNQRMTETAEQNGLEIDQYSQIAQALNEDSQLFERYRTIREQMITEIP